MKQLQLSNKCNHDTLINFGFKKYGMNYKMFIPLYQKNNETLIELELLISSVDQYIGYDVIDKCNDTLYVAYYNQSECENLVLTKIKEKIIKILKDMEEKEIIMKGCF